MGARKRIEQAEKGTIRMIYFGLGFVTPTISMDALTC